MSVQNGERLATKQDLADMYQSMLPYLGGMPEMLANKFSKGDLYSTDEKIIGQWTDGKPLYQKTITTTVSTTQVDNEYFGSIADTLFANDIEMAFVIGDKSYYNISSIATRAFDKVEYETDDKKIYFWTHYARTNVTAHFTLQYTKQSDTTISIGEDTDYSTEEKIIGTWIDGKPLYQKTVELPSVSSGDNAIPISNIDYIVSSVATLNNSINIVSNTSIFFDSSHYCVGVVQKNVSTGNVVLYVSIGSGWSSWENKPWKITIQYTKTTN